MLYKISSFLKRDFSCLGHWSSAVMAVAAIVALVVVCNELSQITKQNETLEATYRATYRPLGEICFEGGEKFDCTFALTKAGHWSFLAKPIVHNIGRGLLIYIGSLSYVCLDSMNFQRQFLEGHIGTVAFDGVHPDVRLQPIKIDAKLGVKIKNNVLDSICGTYLYSLYLYSDLAGRLYDTQRMDFIRLLKDSCITEPRPIPSTSDSVMLSCPVLDTGSLRSVQTYHAYTQSETESLIQRLREQNRHPLADVIENL